MLATLDSPRAHEQTDRPAGRSPIASLDDVLHADPDQFVAKYADVAAVNLACARGLPNADESKFAEYLTLLDTIADAVRRETERTLRLFKVKPAQFHNSEAVFRLYTMEHVFRARFGIRYDPLVHKTIESGQEWTSSDSSEIFIHGILSEKRTGTCSSLPTFAIAVGRRLGYPLKLVLAPNHTLYRWDDGIEVINLQHTEAGGEVRSDESFHEWPRKWDAIDYRINECTKVWLHSMTPRQEASKFLCNRAILLRDAERFQEALQAVDAAARFNPINPACNDIRWDIVTRLQAWVQRHTSTAKPVERSGVGLPVSRMYSPETGRLVQPGEMAGSVATSNATAPPSPGSGHAHASPGGWTDTAGLRPTVISAIPLHPPTASPPFGIHLPSQVGERGGVSPRINGAAVPLPGAGGSDTAAVQQRPGAGNPLHPLLAVLPLQILAASLPVPPAEWGHGTSNPRLNQESEA